MSTLNFHNRDEDDLFAVFESEVDVSFAFLVADFRFQRSPSRRIGRSIVVVFERDTLCVECVYEFGESISITIVYTPSSAPAVGCTIHEAMAVRCPEENGWPYAKRLPDSWPRSSNLRDPDVIALLLANYARVLLTHLSDLLQSTSDTNEVIKSLTRKGRSKR